VIWTTEENARLFRLAAKHGIEPKNYKTLAECIADIEALDRQISNGAITPEILSCPHEDHGDCCNCHLK